MNNNPYINEYGTNYWKNDKGLFHRIDGHAIEWPDGDKEWYVDGKRHRIGGPAIEGADGTKSWWVNGELYRVDGPAVEETERHNLWFIHYDNISSINYFLKLVVL